MIIHIFIKRYDDRAWQFKRFEIFPGKRAPEWLIAQRLMMHGPDLEGRGGGDNARYFSRLAARKDIYLGDYVGSVKMWVRKCRAGAWSEKRKRRLLKMGNLFKYAIDSEWRIHSEYKSSRSADLTFRDHQRSEVYHIMQFPKCMHHFGRCESNTQTTHRRIELYATNYCKYRNDQKKQKKCREQ